MPDPIGSHSNLSSSAQPGTASDRPNSTASPASGCSLNACGSLAALRSSVRSMGWPFAVAVARCASSQGTIVSGRSTVKTTGSSTPFRWVATWLPCGTSTGAGCGAESQ